MTVSYVNGFGTAGTTQATTKSVTLPSTVLAGDYALLCISCVSGTTITAPAGWDLVGNYTNGTTQAIFYHRALLSTDASKSYTFTSDTSQRISAAGTAYRTTAGAVAGMSRSETASATLHPVPNPSAPSTDTVVAVSFLVEQSATPSTSASQPSGYTLRWQSAGSGGSDASYVGVADRLATSIAAGATITGGSWTGNVANQSSITFTFGLSEAAPLTVSLAITPPNPAKGQLVTAVATPNNGSGSTRQYTFGFGDGTPAVGPQQSPSVTHVWNSTDVFSLTLSAV